MHYVTAPFLLTFMDLSLKVNASKIILCITALVPRNTRNYIIYPIDTCKEILITMPSKICWKTAILYMYDWYTILLVKLNIWISETKPKTTLWNVNYKCIFT